MQLLCTLDTTVVYSVVYLLSGAVVCQNATMWRGGYSGGSWLATRGLDYSSVLLQVEDAASAEPTYSGVQLFG